MDGRRSGKSDHETEVHELNIEISKLESKREELEARLATARLKGDLVGVNTISLLLCQCHEKISAARASDVVKGVSKRRTSQ